MVETINALDFSLEAPGYNHQQKFPLRTELSILNVSSLQHPRVITDIHSHFYLFHENQIHLVELLTIDIYWFILQICAQSKCGNRDTNYLSRPTRHLSVPFMTFQQKFTFPCYIVNNTYISPKLAFTKYRKATNCVKTALCHQESAQLVLLVINIPPWSLLSNGQTALSFVPICIRLPMLGWNRVTCD